MSNCSSCPSKSSCSKEKDTCGVVINPYNKIKNVIGVMSGKGGVGKSTVSTVIARKLAKKGYKVGVLDADVTGPSIPRLLGLKNKKVESNGKYFIPVENNEGIKVISLNLLIDDENEPVIWRGPVIAGVIKQFWEEVLWGEIDYLVVDMPPGTGDVALTVMQTIPLSGIVMVSIPQDMVSMIVAKAINMAKKMDVNILGIVENMSYVTCPDCDKKIYPFGEYDSKDFLEEMNTSILARLPMTRDISCLSKGEDIEENKEVDSIFNNMIDEILKGMEMR